MEAQILAGDRMAKLQLISTKRHCFHPKPTGTLQGGTIPVLHISKERHSAVGHLGANLVKTSGVNLNIRQGNLVVTHSQCLQYMVA